MARCARCDTEISRSFVFCYPCSKRPKVPMQPLGAQPDPPSLNKPTWRNKPPRAWHHQERAPSPVIVHEIEPEQPNEKRLHKLRQQYSLRSWKKSGRRMSVDNDGEKD